VIGGARPATSEYLATSDGSRFRRLRQRQPGAALRDLPIGDRPANGSDWKWRNEGLRRTEDDAGPVQTIEAANRFVIAVQSMKSKLPPRTLWFSPMLYWPEAYSK